MHKAQLEINSEYGVLGQNSETCLISLLTFTASFPEVTSQIYGPFCIWWSWTEHCIEWTQLACALYAQDGCLPAKNSSMRRSIIERVLSMRLVYQRANQARALSFEYLNRQLVWHELSELVLFLLPLINVEKIKRTVKQLLPSNSFSIASRGQIRRSVLSPAASHS